MRPEKLNYILSSISSLKGVGPKLELIINKLGIYKNIHFVWNIPNNILERKFYENIHDAEINSLVTLNLKIIKHEPSRFKRQPYKIKCICGDTNIDLVYFNARHPMLRQMLPTNENRLISGKLEYFRNTFQITHPSHVSALNNNKIIKSKEAVYSLTSGLNQKIMNKLTDQILNNLPNFNEWIENSILNKYKFKRWNEVVKNLHNPSDNNIKNKNLLRRRLAFDELLSHQLAIGIMRNFNQKKKGLKITSENKTLNKFYSNLDFQLTNSQNNVIKEILQDLESSNQMIRLLQGDVGSGKTIVALISMIKVFESNFQSALMVPTTILAFQHYENILNLLKDSKINVLVLTGKDKGKERKEKLDKIANGEKEYMDCVEKTYKPFKNNLDDKIKTVDISEQRELKDLGVHPETNRPVTVRLTRYGPTIQMGTKDDEEKPKWAALTPEQKKNIDAITLDDAIRLFKLPEKIGEFEGEDILINIGPFGPYVKCGKTNVSMKEVDIFSLSEQEAISRIEEKREIDANREIKIFESSGIKVLNGMYGPYITDGKKNVRVPKDIEPQSLDENTCIEMIKNAPKRRARRTRAKR